VQECRKRSFLVRVRLAVVQRLAKIVSVPMTCPKNYCSKSQKAIEKKLETASPAVQHFVRLHHLILTDFQHLPLQCIQELMHFYRQMEDLLPLVLQWLVVGIEIVHGDQMVVKSAASVITAV